MKSYGRAPTFLAMTGYEQVRSVAAALAGDREAAERVELVLPETGVCRERPGGVRGRSARRNRCATATDLPSISCAGSGCGGVTLRRPRESGHLGSRLRPCCAQSNLFVLAAVVDIGGAWLVCQCPLEMPRVRPVVIPMGGQLRITGTHSAVIYDARGRMHTATLPFLTPTGIPTYSHVDIAAGRRTSSWMPSTPMASIPISGSPPSLSVSGVTNGCCTARCHNCPP